MRILITNIFSTENKGDAAIAAAQIAAVSAALPEAEVAAQSWNPGRDCHHLDCRVVGPFFEMVSQTHPDWPPLRRHAHTAATLARTLFAASWFRMTGRLPRPFLPARLREPLEEFARADLVISVGGNFLYAYPGRNSFSFLKHCHQILLAQEMGKPVVLLAQSLGPVSVPLHVRLLRRIVDRAAFVLVREELSLKALEDLGVRKGHVRLTPDTAFLLPPAPAEAAEAFLARHRVPQDSVRIGITVRDWEYPGSADSSAKTRDFYIIMGEVIDWMVREWGAHVLLLPQCISPDQDDRRCMANVAEHVREKDRLRVVNDDISPGLLKAICGRLDLFIGTRMHSNIFATAMTTPTFAISYQPKTDGIMRMLDMERWKAPIAEITADSLRARLAELWSERASVRAHLAERIPAIQDQATCDIRNTLSQLLETRPNI